MAELKTAVDKVGAENALNVKIVFVTVDLQRDSPPRVQEYVNHFNKDFIGVSVSETELAKVWGAYGVFGEIADENSAAGYEIDHTARVTLIDQNGNLRSSYSDDTPVEDIVHNLNLLLKG